MRILYHHRTLGDGAEGIHISSIIEAFRLLGHETKVAALIGEKTNVTTGSTSRLNTLTRHTPRVVYEMLEVGYLIAGYRLMQKCSVAWKPDMLYERYSLFNYAGIAFARKEKIPLILEVNAPLAYEREKYEKLVLRRLAKAFEQRVCQKASFVIAVSTPLKDYLVEQGVSSHKIRVVPNGTDPELFQPNNAARKSLRQDLGVSDDTVVIGFVGILRPWHGVETLCEAMASLDPSRRKVHLLLVGDGPIRKDIEQLIEQKKLKDFVTITGRIPHSQVPSYITAFDIGISPRVTFYASPMKLLEYMATGVPVVAPRMANIQDIVTDGKEGKLFEPEDIQDLSAVLSQLIDNAEVRLSMGRTARETILSTRTWLHNAQLVLDLMKEPFP